MANARCFTGANLITGASLIAIMIASGAIASGATSVVTAAEAAEELVSGTVPSAGGEKMGGVPVSAKAAGSSITTTVYTDESGNYYFPPLPSGSYRVWAQAVTYATGRGSVELTAGGHQDFVLAPMKDWVRQLPGDELLAALPGDTPDDARMKTLVRKNCTGCHIASYPLQHPFDQAGWSAVPDLMNDVNGLGTYQGPEHKPNPTIESHKAELAAYLARARGPGESAMKFN